MNTLVHYAGCKFIPVEAIKDKKVGKLSKEKAQKHGCPKNKM